MELSKLIEATDVLGELSHAFSRLPENEREAVQAALSLSIAQLYLAQYANHLSDGIEPYEALVATARGDMKFTASQQDLMRSMGLSKKD